MQGIYYSLLTKTASGLGSDSLISLSQDFCHLLPYKILKIFYRRLLSTTDKKLPFQIILESQVTALHPNTLHVAVDRPMSLPTPQKIFYYLQHICNLFPGYTTALTGCSSTSELAGHCESKNVLLCPQMSPQPCGLSVELAAPLAKPRGRSACAN